MNMNRFVCTSASFVAAFAVTISLAACGGGDNASNGGERDDQQSKAAGIRPTAHGYHVGGPLSADRAQKCAEHWNGNAGDGYEPAGGIASDLVRANGSLEFDGGDVYAQSAGPDACLISYYGMRRLLGGDFVYYVEQWLIDPAAGSYDRLVGGTQMSDSPEEAVSEGAISMVIGDPEDGEGRLSVFQP